MKNIDYKELQEWIKDGKPFHLIDVREKSEHQAFNIGGVCIPLSHISRLPLPINVEQPIVIYCKRGIRSQLAIQRLSLRFPTADFYNLAHGILHLHNIS